MEKRIVKKGLRVQGFKGSRVESKKLKAESSKGKEQSAERKAHGAKSSELWPFILKHCDMGGNYSVNVKELYDHYRETGLTIKFSNGNKLSTHLLSFKDFEEELKKALPFVGKEKRKPERRMYFTGIRLKAQSAESIEHSAKGKLSGKAVEGGGDWDDEESIDFIPEKIITKLTGEMVKEADKEIEKHIDPDFTSNDMLKGTSIFKGEAGMKSPIEMQIDKLEKQINALNDGMRALGIRVIPVSACDDEISNTYPVDFEVKDMMPDNNRSRVFNRLDLLLSKVAWIATVQKRIEELLEI